MANNKAIRHKSKFIKECLNFFVKSKSMVETYNKFGLYPCTLRQWILNSKNKEIIMIYESLKRPQATYEQKMEVIKYKLTHHITYAGLVKKFGWSKSAIKRWYKQFLKDIDLLHPKSGRHKNHDSKINIFSADIKSLNIVQENKYYDKVVDYLSDETRIGIYQFMYSKPDINISKMSKILDFSRSAYYTWKENCHPINRFDFEFNKLIIDVHTEHPDLGVRGVCDYIGYHHNVIASENKVRRYLRHNNFKAETSKPFKQSYEVQDDQEGKNFINRIFTSDKPNTLWFMDYTYIKVGYHYEYVLLIVDAFNKEVILCKAHKKKNSFNVRSELRKIVKERNVDTTKLTIHTDQGREFNNENIRKFTEKNGIRHSFSRKGTPLDNALIECIIGKFKMKYNLSKEKVLTTNKLNRLCKSWKYKYNFLIPQRALGKVPPAFFN